MKTKIMLFPSVGAFFWTLEFSSTFVSSLASSYLSTPIVPPPPAISMPVWSLACPTTALSIDNGQITKEETVSTAALAAAASTLSSAPSQPSATSMNIVTYCMPVSIVQPKIWTIALYHNTLTKDSFLKYGHGVLQLLTHDHSAVVPVLGKHSGYDDTYAKSTECNKVGFGWTFATPKAIDNEEEEEERNSYGLDYFKCNHHLLPNCASYVQLELLEETPPIDVGDHVVVMAKVLQTGVWDEETGTVLRVSSTAATSTGTKSSNSPQLPRRSVLPPPPLDETTVLYTGQLRKQGII